MFLGMLLVALALAVVSYLLMPRPKAPSATIGELQTPTADMGRPIPVVFGEVMIKAPNCLWYGDIQTVIKKVKM